jgi:hypothetical protein
LALNEKEEGGLRSSSQWETEATGVPMWVSVYTLANEDARLAGGGGGESKKAIIKTAPLLTNEGERGRPFVLMTAANAATAGREGVGAAAFSSPLIWLCLLLHAGNN